MIEYLLDTDTISLLQEQHPNVVRRVIETPIELLAISVITVEEQLSGWSRTSDRHVRHGSRPQPMNTWQRLLLFSVAMRL